MPTRQLIDFVFNNYFNSINDDNPFYSWVEDVVISRAIIGAASRGPSIYQLSIKYVEDIFLSENKYWLIDLTLTDKYLEEYYLTLAFDERGMLANAQMKSESGRVAWDEYF